MAVIDGKWLSKEGLTYFWSKIKTIFTKQTETNVIANLGAKNLLNNKLLYTASGTGVTIVSNGDGTYSLSGTATGTATYLYTSIANFSSLYGIETGKSYTITAGSNKVLIRIDYSTNGTSWDNGEDGQPLVSNVTGEATFMVPASTIGLYIRFRSTASHGSLNGVILKPMIRRAEITDATFQPYAPTNRELYETKTEQTETNVIANLGAKNLFDIAAPGAINYKETHDISNDTVTITGSAGFSRYVVPVSLKAGSYIFTANVDSISTSGRVRFNTASDGTGTSVTSQIDFSQAGDISREFTINQDTAFFVMIYSSTSSTDTSSSLVISQCMIRRAEITDATFQPYAPTNRELYETKTEQTETNAIVNLGAKNMLYISNTPGYTATSHGRTFTVLSDGGIKITGASSDSSNADFYVIGSWGNRSILLNENKDSCLIRMACDTDYGYSQIRLRVMNRSTGSTVNETGVETNKDVRLSHVITTVFVSVFPSVTLPEDGTVVYPMIRRAEITDSTFQPYAPTNRELYETRFASKTMLPNDVDLNDIKTGGIYNGVTSTGNSAVHMPVANGSFMFVLTVIEANESIIQIFKQLNSAGDSNFYIRRFYIYNSDWDGWYQFTGTQV